MTFNKRTGLVFLLTTMVGLRSSPGGDVVPVVIRNGGMSQGIAMPADWGGKGAVRDTEVFKVGPASLRVSNGQASQRLDGLAGRRIRIAGWMKISGDAKAQVAVHSFADGYKNNLWQQVVYRQGDTDWTAFEKEIEVPAWTAWSEVLLKSEGPGYAWIDEVRDAGGTVDPGRVVSAEEEMMRNPPARDKPWTAGWCIHDWRPAWFGMHDGFVKRTKEGGIGIVFYGDSITQGWNDAGKKTWAERYEPRRAVNYGIGGDSTRQLLWRIGHGEVDGLVPNVVVLAIGTNNLYDDPNSGTDEEIARGIEAVVSLLREKLPRSKILLCAILPRQNDYFCNRIAKINAITRKLDDGKTVRFLDMTDRFLESPGRVKAALFVADQLHLAPPGYETWAATMEPLLREMLTPDDRR